MAERWSQDRVDQLARQLEDARDELSALRGVPWTVAEHTKRFDQMREDMQHGRDLEERRFERVYSRLDKLAADLTDLRKQCDDDQEETRQLLMARPTLLPNGRNGRNGKTGWLNLATLFIGAASGIGVPIAIAVYAALNGG